MSPEQEIRELELYRASLISHMEVVRPSQTDFQDLGRTEFELYVLRKEVLRQVKNDLD